METLKYTCVESFTVWCASLRGEEVVIFKRPFFVDGRHGNTKKYSALHIDTGTCIF